MELKIVYRILRKISDWTLDGFYSEVFVDGFENVPQTGPLLIASSHHNEIIDVATLAVTIPHRRTLSFWTKSTLFANPITNAILLSAGSIPVHRNPNREPPTSTPSQIGRNGTDSLFAATCAALAKGQAIGIFPEGSSYTQPQIMQVKEGAGWVAVEYVRSEAARHKDVQGGKCIVGGAADDGLTIVPVGIVYTDKARYRSHVSVKYGKPFRLDAFAESMDSAEDAGDAARALVKNIMGRVEEEMRALTINAPDWDTLYAARMARDMLWEDEQDIPLRDFVEVTQTLVKLFTSSPGVPPPHVKSCLIKYSALLHHTSLQHAHLTHLVPLSPSPMPAPTCTRALAGLLAQTLTTLLHPQFILALPSLLAFLPAYALARLAAPLAGGEEEAVAQFKAVFGGVGVGLGAGGVGWCVVRVLAALARSRGGVGASFGAGGWLVWLGRALGGAGAGAGGVAGGVTRPVRVLGVVYGTAWVLVKWHNALIGGNYRRYGQLAASYRLFVGLLSADVRLEDLGRYTTPPPPPTNIFIKPRTAAASSTGTSNAESTPAPPETESIKSQRGPSGAAAGLIRHVLAARWEATVAVRAYLGGVLEGRDGLDADAEGREAVELLEGKGARVRFA